MNLGEDGTEIYGQEAGESFALAQEGVSNVSGVVESVIEVAGNPEDNGTDGTGKAEVQEFTFVEESKEFTLIEGMEEEGMAPPRDFECELCNKKFTKVEILKRHIKTHLKDKVFRHALPFMPLITLDNIYCRSSNVPTVPRPLTDEMFLMTILGITRGRNLSSVTSARRSLPGALFYCDTCGHTEKVFTNATSA